MNNKRLKHKLAYTTIMMLLFAGVLFFSGFTLAWIYIGSDQLPADRIRGSLRVAYFNGGNGTAPVENATYKEAGSDYPAYEVGGANSRQGSYQIDNATQLYNFAWLQYLGYFSTPTYFVLTSDIDASHLVMPPVGTSSAPFVGCFDGNGYTITGLHVSNDKEALNNTDVDGNKFNIPHNALENNERKDSAEIVGFFGVIGDMSEDYSAAFVPTVKNVTLENTTIDTQTEDSLFGIAAGYVNGIMEDVTVSGTSTINNSAMTHLSYTDDMSDYALVGYCTEPYRKVLKVETVNVYDPHIELGDGRLGDTGQGTAWGNTIDMKSIYDSLLDIYTGTEVETAKVPSAVSVTVDRTHENEVRTESVIWSDTAAAVNVQNYNFNVLNYKNDYSSYSFIDRRDHPNFIYLYGDNKIGTDPALTVTTNYIDNAYYIHLDNHYLSFNGSTFSDKTAKANAAKWIIDSQGYIYTVIQNGNNYIRYYIINDNGTLSSQQVAANAPIPANVNKWTINDTSIGNNNYYLTFRDGSWKLMLQENTYITDVDEEDQSIHLHYLTIVNGTIQNTNTRSDAITWVKNYTDSEHTQFTLSCKTDNTTYYLMSNEGALQLSIAPLSPTIWRSRPAAENPVNDNDNYPKIYTEMEDDDEGNGYAIYYNDSDDVQNWELTHFTEVASGTGIGNEWGVSIPMKDMYNNLYYIKTNSLASRNYTASKTIVIDERTGEKTEKDTVSGTLADGYYGAATKHLRFVLENFGEITFSDRNTTNANYDAFMYLTDVQNTSTNSSAIKIIRILDQDIPANYIRNGSDHLSLNSSYNGFVNSDEANATKWIFDENGYIYVDCEGASSVERRYISVSGGTLTVSSSKTTKWTFVETTSRLYCTVSGQTYYLAYDNGWQTVTYKERYLLINNGNYLTISNGRLITSSSPVYWYKEENGYYTTINNVIYHIDNDGTLPGAMYINDDNGNYLTISGDSLSNTTNKNDAVLWYFSGNSSAIYASSGNTTYYLYNNNNTLGISTSASTTWTIDRSDNKISSGERYIYYNGSTWVLTRTAVNVVSDGDGHYVYINSGYLYTTDDPNIASDFFENGSSLTVYADNTAYSFPIDNGRIFNGSNMLYYEDGAWRLSEPSYKVITDGNGHYLSTNGSNITNTDLENATHWTFSNGNGGYIYTSINNTTYYLNYNSGIFGIGAGLSISTSQSTSWTYNSNTGLYTSNNYINCNNGSWSYNRNSGNARVETIDINSNAQQDSLTRSPVTAFESNALPFDPTENGNTSIDLTSVTSRPFTITMSQEKVGETYFPLQVNVDTAKSDASRFSTNIKNTGYVISGYTDNGGDIRVSKYASSNISNSLTNSQLDNAKVRTIMGGTDRLISNYGINKFVKYTASRTTLNETLSADTYVYGLHFMNATISKDSLVVAPSAVINGKKYTDYQMPKDTIDFTLKEKGYINFLAGTYYTNNNSFFSLHKIERNDDKTILSVREISEIYGNDNKRVPYIYKFSDGSYESWTYYPSGKVKQHNTYSSVPSGYSKVFDTAWIKVQQSLTNNAVYYFEIPADAGEYALGSVTGGTGAYLLYLDIGTGGSEKTPEGNSELITDGYNTFESAYELTSITYYEAATESNYQYFNTYPTYFPLAMNAAGNNVSSRNTGYIISGSNYTSGAPPSDIRVSRYNKTLSSNYQGIGRSLTNGQLIDSKMYTYKINSNGTGTWQTISAYGSDNFNKYIRSKRQLQEVLDSDQEGYVYGLHFMDASLGATNLITVPSVTINGNSYTDYEMPRDSIDFTLRSRGYINVFAGTYFSGSTVNTFFSLHKIERDENMHITSIREIKAIYTDNEGNYIYQYAGDSVPSGTKIFDTSCLTSPSNIVSDSVYYFEIPVDAGEYALGSVSGKNGGYLLYLDISTHQADAVIIREKIEKNTLEYELPKGVMFEGSETTVFEISDNSSGVLTFTVNNNGTVTAIHTADGNAPTSVTLNAIYSAYDHTTEKISSKDKVGSSAAVKETINGNTTYYYRENDAVLTEVTEPDDITRVAANFDSGIEWNDLLIYEYRLENANSVENTSDIEYSSEAGLAISSYKITATAIVEAVDAAIRYVNPNADYIALNEVTSLQTSQTVPVQAAS